MSKARVAVGLLAGSLLVGSGVSSAWAAPTVAQMLSFRPKQEGVVCSTPAAAELEACKVELVRGTGKGSGWLLKNAQGQPLRRFFDSNGDNKIDIWSYYQNGNEVYREIDANTNERVDQYRWLHQAGTRWGLDLNEDGRIDTWKDISPEEVSQEVLQAVANRDLARFQALLITEAELKAADLPAAEADRIRALVRQAPVKFQDTCTKLASLGQSVRWLHLESGLPQCLPADSHGMRFNLVRRLRDTLTYEANGKTDALQLGEMIQLSGAWRLVDGPVPGHAPVIVGPNGEPADVNTLAGPGVTPMTPELQPLLEQLRKIDEQAPRGVITTGPNPEFARYQVQRADVLERIVQKVKPEDREQWYRQLADSLSAAAQASGPGDQAAYTRLVQLRDRFVSGQPGSNLAAYATYREMNADYHVKISDPKGNFTQVQNERLARLAKFVQDYPKADDAPNALSELGMLSELVGKEAEAKKWYEQLVKNFHDDPLAEKAAGALRRLDLEGKRLELAGNVLGSNQAFSLSQLGGKVVIVYYWASWNQQCVDDFARLKTLLATYGSKGVELVCVCLDNTAGEAVAFLQRNPAPGIHLFKEGGSEASPLAKDYGIWVLPNLFLVGKDGKVVSRTVQINGLEDEIKKLVN